MGLLKKPNVKGLRIYGVAIYQQKPFLLMGKILVRVQDGNKLELNAERPLGTQQTMERVILPLIVRPLYTLIAASRIRSD